VKVNGLICDFCVQALKKTFKKQAAVRAVAIDLNAKEVRLGFKPGMSLNDATIGKLIKDAGYNVVSIKRRAA
jgi:copper chaperone CopZ